MAVAGPIPTGPRRTSLHGPSPLAVAGDASGSKEAAGKAEDVYDEAWDVRAARLGLEFSCVQETDIDSCAAPPKEGQTTPEAAPPASEASPPATTAPPPANPTATDTDTDYDYAYNRAWQLSQEVRSG